MSDQTQKSGQGQSTDEGKGAQQGDNAKPGVQEQNEARKGGQGGAHDKNG